MVATSLALAKVVSGYPHPPPAEDFESANLRGDAFDVEVIQFKAAHSPRPEAPSDRPGILMVGLVLENDLYLAILARMRHRHARFVGNEIDAAGGMRTFIVEDNSGNRLQFLTRQ